MIIGTNRRRRRALFLLLLLVSILGIILFMWLLSPGLFVLPENGEEEEEDDGEDDSNGDFETQEGIYGEYEADVHLLEGEGGGGGQEPGEPEELFFDDFEHGDLDEWSSDTYHVYATSTESYEGDYSAKFHPRGYTTEYLHKNDAVDIGDEDSIHLHFAVYIDESFRVENEAYGGTVQPACLNKDYLVVKFYFEGGKTLVYLIAGTYWHYSSDEAVVDIRDQVDDISDWETVDILDIQDDYEAQFGDDVPHEGDLRFQMRSKYGAVYLDEVLLLKTPRGGDHWSHEGTKVDGYYATVAFKVEVTDDINKSTVWADIEIYVTIENAEEAVEEDLLLQEALIDVLLFGDWINWTSACFHFPENDTIYGGTLTYTLDMKITVSGQVKSTGEWVSAEGDEDSFGTFTVSWVDYGTYVLLAIGALLGSLGVTGVVLGIRRGKRLKKIANCDCLGEADCSCDLPKNKRMGKKARECACEVGDPDCSCEI